MGSCPAGDSGHAETEREVASILLGIGAVHIRPGRPFVFTSGTRSPAYVDCRRIISFVDQRRTIISLMSELVRTNVARDAVQVIAGGETAGIPFASWLSEELSAPMIYVRKEPKGFGRESQIEGALAPGAHVLLVEDLIFDSKSKLNFIDGIEAAGGRVSDVVVVFEYGLSQSREALAHRGVRLHSLTTWSALLPLCIETGQAARAAADEIRAFLADPAAWTVAHPADSEY